MFKPEFYLKKNLILHIFFQEKAGGKDSVSNSDTKNPSIRENGSTFALIVLHIPVDRQLQNTMDFYV